MKDLRFSQVPPVFLKYTEREIWLRQIKHTQKT